MKKVSKVAVALVAISLILSAGISMAVPAALPGVSVVTGDITEWQTGYPITGSLVRVIDTATGEEVGNFTTGADGGYAIVVDFPTVGETMEAKITASKDDFQTNYTITMLTGSMPPETKTINLSLKEAIAPELPWVLIIIAIIVVLTIVIIGMVAYYNYTKKRKG